MAAKYILATLAVVFLIVATLRLVRVDGRFGPAVKAWFVTGGIFAIVAGWLWYRN